MAERKSESPEPEQSQQKDGYEIFCLLSIGEIFEHRIFNFPALQVRLRRVSYKLDSETATREGFIREDPDIDNQVLPFSILVEHGYENAFLTDVNEFDAVELGGKIRPESLLEGKVLVFWNWTLAAVCDNLCDWNDPERMTCTAYTDSENEEAGDGGGTTESEDGNSGGCSCSPETIPFKCIGSDKESSYQIVLKEVSESLHNGLYVNVFLKPEPTNPFDNQAIQFVCNLRGNEYPIGYVCSECLSDVHHHIEQSWISKVEFAWVKFRSYYGKIPRYYAAISITSKQGWSTTVKRSASTLY